MADTEARTLTRSELSPLLSSDRQYLHDLHQNQDFFDCHIIKIHGEETFVWTMRHHLQHYLSSKWGHYFVILLVAADIAAIFADFLISLHVCEHSGEKAFNPKGFLLAGSVLSWLSLSFSCLFMAELICSTFAFGFGYFKNPFHIFDAVIIIVGFVIDVALKGPLEEAGSLIVILRLWRVFKIIEEFSAGADDQVEELHEKILSLQRQNEEMQKENDGLRRRASNGLPDGEALPDGDMDGHAR